MLKLFSPPCIFISVGLPIVEAIFSTVYCYFWGGFLLLKLFSPPCIFMVTLYRFIPLESSANVAARPNLAESVLYRLFIVALLVGGRALIIVFHAPKL